MKNFKVKKILNCFMIQMFFFSLIGCASIQEPIADDLEGKERGDVIAARSLGTYTPEFIRNMLAGMNVNLPFEFRYSVEALSVTYVSADAEGNPVKVSGGMFVPLSSLAMPMISIQHGTETKRDKVASVSPVNSVEGITGVIMACMGYMAVVPDYPGFGVSEIMHPYFHAESLIPGIIDLMRVAKSYCQDKGIDLNGKIFLAGYSEGGYTTLVTQKAMEEQYADEFELTGVAPCAGIYDLAGMLQDMFQRREYSTPAYLAYFFTAYDKVYGWDRIDEIFKAPYASRMEGLFDGSNTFPEIAGQLPSTFSALMHGTFVSKIANGNEPGVVQAIEENTWLNWKPVAPIHFFHGDADDVAPYQNALTAVAAFTSMGATDIHLTTIPGGNHDTSGLPCVVGFISWIESLR